MRLIALAACALAAPALAQPRDADRPAADPACTAMTDRTETRSDAVGDDALGLSDARREAARETLAAARKLADADAGGCLTPVNAASALLARGMSAMPEDTVAVVELRAWDYGPLYEDGWRVRAMMDSPACDEQGEEIGEVEDLLMRADGTITAAVIEGGGMLDIGDSHVRVPWDQVVMRPAGDGGGVTVPLTDEGLTDYSLFGDDRDTPQIRPRELRVSTLPNEPVRLREGEAYGFVEDALVVDGRVAATVLRPDVAWRGRRGMPATPFVGYPYGYGTGYGYYVVPYDRAQLEALEDFDLEKVMGPKGDQG